jgi:hypothetical protein
MFRSRWTIKTCWSECRYVLIVDFKILCLIKGAFVDEKNFDVIKMYGMTIKK